MLKINFYRKKNIIRFLISVLLLANVTISAYSASVRGVWVPDPQYTSVLKSYQNVLNFVTLLDSLNLNSVFIVSYANSKTIYPSSLLKSRGVYAHPDSTNMLSPFMVSYDFPLKSPTGDPVRDLIKEAHKRKIKVFFWYEFGFMADIKTVSPENNPLLAKNPSWLGMGNDGKPANYNGQDCYFNAYNADVQKFLIDLITEGLQRYPEVDGIQGDDRMPAMCINSGYDVYTMSKYKAETGKEPPANFKDSAWMQWRINILNDFGKTLYKTVKKVNPRVQVSFAPNPYPWSRDNLLQEWPQWVSDGICDLLAVQCYRRDSLSFSNTVKSVQNEIKRTKKKNQLFAPGILLMVNGQLMDHQQIKKQLQAIRALKTDGEIFFYNEALNNKAIKQTIMEFYKRKNKFPIQKR